MGHAWDVPEIRLLGGRIHAMTCDDIHRLRRQGFSIRAIASHLGLSRMKVHRTLTAPVDYDDDDVGDDYSDDDEYRPVTPADLADAIEVFTPPFEFVGLIDTVDYRGRPAMTWDGHPVGLSLLWRDAFGCDMGELDLYRWCMQRVQDITLEDFPTPEEYLAGWNRGEAEADAVKRHAWDSVRAAGVVYDDTLRQWVRRPRSVRS